MIRHLALLPILTSIPFLSCSPTHADRSRPASPPPQDTPTPKQTTPTPQAPMPSPLPPAVAPEAPSLIRDQAQGVRLFAVRFHPATHRLQIADQPQGPGSLWSDAAEAAQAFHGIAAINAGFFNPDGSPLGLVLAQGQRRGSLNRSSLGSAYLVTSPTPRLLRRSSTIPTSDFLQAGPFLVENRHPTPGLNASRHALRSILALDTDGFCYLIQTGSCTLHHAALALSNWSPHGRPITTALNLDGGRSCDLWASPSLSGGLHQRAFFSNPVRNFLVLTPKP